VSQPGLELTAELLVDGAEPADPVISPDGRRVAYVVATWDANRNRLRTLRVAPADASSPPRTLASGPGLTGAPRWAPDSGSLVVLVGRQLHRIGLDGGDLEPLTSWRGQIAGHLPLADGRLAVIAADEPDAQDERRKAEGDDALVWGQDVPAHRLWLLDPVAGELRPLGELGGRHVVEVVQRPDGGPLAVISWACPQDEPGAFTAALHVVDPDTGKTWELGPAGLDAGSLAWWHDGGHWHVAYLAVTPPGPVGGMAVFDVTVPADGTAAGPRNLTAAGPRNLTAGLDACPAGLAQVAGGPPLALFAAGLDSAFYRLDPGPRRFRRVLTRPGRLDSLTASRDGAVIAVLASTAREPRDVQAGPPGGPLVRLSDTRPEARRIRWGAQERLSYQACDGLALDGLLILPPGRSRADGPFPLITLVHGGPYGRYADQFHGGWWAPGQWLAAAGYAIFLPNPRGSQGRGHEFAAAVSGAVGTDEWTDLLRGIDLLIEDGTADPDRLGIGGWSHGGFMAAWAVGQTDRFKTAVMGAGISDWGMQTGVGEFGNQEAGLGGSCGWESPGPHRHHQLSPISYASRVRTPVLILHGQEDTNVPLGQAVYFHRALSRYGVEHELVVYPREGHNITERQHRIDLLHRLRSWFARHLADPLPDVVPTWHQVIPGADGIPGERPEEDETPVSLR
jgi:dipeptidyl aminopeptidase/acylaminoacyl peptidase